MEDEGRGQLVGGKIRLAGKQVGRMRAVEAWSCRADLAGLGALPQS